MYRSTPWTLENEKKKKSAYIKNRESNLAISVSKVRKLFENNKEKFFSNNEIAKEIGVSIGTVSDITNRMEAIGDIKIVKVRQLKSALSQVFQHKDGSMNGVEKERGKSDAVVNVLYVFQENPNEVYTKDSLMKVVNNTEAKIRRSLQILLQNGNIKLVGSTDKGAAQYQHSKGKKKAIPVRFEEDERYSSIGSFIKKNKLKYLREDIFRNLENSKGSLFYSSLGLVYEYPVEVLVKSVEKLNNKNNRKNIIENLFS